MSQQFIQMLTVYLKGGQLVKIPFNAEKADTINPQIEAFMKAFGDKNKVEGNFLFQGARPVLVRLPDVSCIDVVSLVRKTEEAGEAQPAEAENDKAKKAAK